MQMHGRAPDRGECSTAMQTLINIEQITTRARVEDRDRCHTREDAGPRGQPWRTRGSVAESRRDVCFQSTPYGVHIISNRPSRVKMPPFTKQCANGLMHSAKTSSSSAKLSVASDAPARRPLVECERKLVKRVPPGLAPAPFLARNGKEIVSAASPQ